MTEKEQMQKNIEEFSRLQDYMSVCEKDSEPYRRMKRRYAELKVILTASGINLTEMAAEEKILLPFFLISAFFETVKYHPRQN